MLTLRRELAGMRNPALAVIAIAAMFFAIVAASWLLQYGYFGDGIFDDAYFFVRYAGNFLDTGIFEWNRGEGPVHGNTSQLYQLVVTLAHRLTGRNAVLSLSLAAIAGAAFYLLMLPVAHASSRPAVDPRHRRLTLAFVTVLAVFDGQVFPLISSGMETTWAMALVAVSLWSSSRIEAGRGGSAAILANAAAVLAVYATRPDAALLALAAPAGLAMFADDRRTRLAGLAVCALAAALIGAFLIGCALYYGDALPLAFIVKTAAFTALPVEHRVDLGNPLTALWHTILSHKAEAILATIALVTFARLSAVLRGAALGMGAFVAYHLFLVLPVSGDFGRFFAPILPVLMLLAARAVESMLAFVAARPARPLFSTVLLLGLAALMGHRVARVALAIAPTHVLAWETLSPAISAAQAARLAANSIPYYDHRLGTLVDALSQDCSVAATEDGMLSAFAARNRIVDLSGLHDRRLAREGFSASRVLIEQRPDVLVMPYPWYADWIVALEKHPAMERDYVREAPLAAGRPWVAFRRDSQCAARVRKALYGR